jgi:hypothetical protein
MSSPAGHFKGGGSFVRRQWNLVFWVCCGQAANRNSNPYDLAVLSSDFCGFDDDRIHSCNLHDSYELALKLIAWVKSELL